MAHGHCCGGGCGKKHDHGAASAPVGLSVGATDGAQPRGVPTLLKVVGGVAAIAIVATSTIALTSRDDQVKPAVPPAPTVPAAPVAPAAPAAQPAAPAEVAKPATEGVVRHGRPDPIPQPKGTLRVAVYNIENLFLAPKEGEKPLDRAEPKPAEHKKAAAEALRKVNADVIAFQEIQSLATITAFRDEYLADMGYQYIASIDAGDDRGIEQSVLSRYPIGQSKNWVHMDLGGTHNKNRTESDRVPGGPIQFKRSPMMVRIDVPAEAVAKATGVEVGKAKPYSMTIFNVHFKSGRNDTYWREKEAQGTIKLASELMSSDPNANVIIVGDFNARPIDRPVKVMTSAGWIDAFGDLPDTKEFQTHASNRAIDHVMMNPNAAAEMVKESRFVLGTMQRPDGVDWRTTAPPVGYASDHYPVVVDFKLVDQPVPPPAPQAPAKPDAPAKNDDQASN